MSSPDFVPKRKFIAGITNAQNGVVTTTTSHNYATDSWVVLVVPKTYGMKFDYYPVKITVTGLNTFLTNIDTSGMDPFVVPALVQFTPAHCMPASELCDNIAPL